jgi:lysophospholipase L1-like esterase
MKNSITYLIIGILLIRVVGCNTGIEKTVGSEKEMILNQEQSEQPDYGDYYYTKKSIFEILPNDTGEIIFLGNSITDAFEWYELFGNINIKNRGIGGDIIEGVIFRLDEIVTSKPRKIFLMIGTNDLHRNYSVPEILSNYKKLVELIVTKTPDTELYVQSILPTKGDPKRKNADIMEINKGLIEITSAYSLTYVNLFDLFKTEENELNMEYSFDGLHLNGKGYLVWKEAITEHIENSPEAE